MKTKRAIACIRMNVDAYDAELKAQADSDDIGEDLGRPNRLYRQQPHHMHTETCSPGKRATTSDVSH